MASPNHSEPTGPEASRFLGGPASLALAARLLGLEDPDPGARVDRVAWLGDRLEVELGLSAGQPLTLVVEGTKGPEQSRPFLTTGRLDLWYRGQAMPDALEAALRQAAAGWPGLTLEQLRERLEADPDRRPLPDAEPEPEARPSGPDRGPPAAGPLTEPEPQAPEPQREKLGTWDTAQTYADFFALETLELLPYEPIEATNPFVRISHSDLECLSFMPREKASNANLVDFPWIAARASEGAALKAQETTLSTDLTERAVIMGCNAKVRQMLDHVLAQGLDKPIIFTNTCLPATTSEDVVSVLRRYREVAPVTVVSHNRAETEFDEDMLEGLLVERRLKAEGAATARANSVNLIGFARDQTLAELSDLLAELGVEVNTAVLPEVDEQDMDRYPQAALDVFLRVARHWEHFYRQLSLERRSPAIEPAGPFGMAGTRAWLRAVLRALDLDSDLDAAWERRFGPVRADWEQLRSAASELSIGLVVRPRDLICLQDPGCTNGIPILAVLEELGFGLEILFMAGGRDESGLADRVASLLAQPDRHRLTAFEGLAGLRQALADSPVQAVLSNFTYDWRLTEAGKNRISMRHFSMGLAGALRTGRHLVQACRVPFRRRYRRFLARTPMGLRPEARG